MILVSFETICNHANQPIVEGLRLLRALQSSERVVIYARRDKAFIERWLLVHGVLGYDDLILESGPESDWLKSRGLCRLLVVTDPAVAAWAVENGIVTILFCHPKFAVPEHRPTTRSWDAIVAEMDRQAGLEDPVPTDNYFE